MAGQAYIFIFQLFSSMQPEQKYNKKHWPTHSRPMLVNSKYEILMPKINIDRELDDDADSTHGSILDDQM